MITPGLKDNLILREVVSRRTQHTVIYKLQAPRQIPLGLSVQLTLFTFFLNGTPNSHSSDRGAPAIIFIPHPSLHHSWLDQGIWN